MRSLEQVEVAKGRPSQFVNTLAHPTMNLPVSAGFPLLTRLTCGVSHEYYYPFHGYVTS